MKNTARLTGQVSSRQQTTGPAAIILTDSAVSVASLLINRKEVADYLRQFPEDQREAQLQRAIEVGVFCLERASTTQDTEFVRRQIDSLLYQVQTMVSKVPEQTERALLEKLGSGDGQVLAPIKLAVGQVQQAANQKIQEVKNLLEQDLDPTKQTTTLGRALSGLRDLLDPKRTDSIQGHLSESVRTITKADGDLANTVKKVVEDAIKPLALNVNELAKEVRGQEAAEEIAQQTTLKGSDFENKVLAIAIKWAIPNGFQVEHAGPDNQPGDVVLTTSPDSAVPPVTIVVEAKDRGTAVGRKAITQAINEAMDKRIATCGIWVSSTSDGFAKEIGEWAEGHCTRGRWLACTVDLLPVALRFTLVQERLAVLRAAQPDLDAASITSQVQRIRTSLSKIANITRNVTEVRSSAQAIQDEAEALREEVKASLTAMEDALRTQPPPPGPGASG